MVLSLNVVPTGAFLCPIPARSGALLLRRMRGRCEFDALIVAVDGIVLNLVAHGIIGALALEVDDLAALAHDPGQLQDVLVGGVFVLDASRQRLGAVVQSLGSSLGGAERIVAGTPVVGLFVGDDPADRGENLLHRWFLLLSGLSGHGSTSRKLVALRRPGAPARNPTPHHHSAFNGSPSPIRRSRTSR
jgi:hypothetical protein